MKMSISQIMANHLPDGESEVCLQGPDESSSGATVSNCKCSVNVAGYSKLTLTALSICLLILLMLWLLFFLTWLCVEAHVRIAWKTFNTTGAFA